MPKINVNHVEEADLAMVRMVKERLYNDRGLSLDERRNLAKVLEGVLARVESGAVTLEPDHG